MQIEIWPIDNVKPYQRNPRDNEAAVDAVARSIEEYGFRQPIVVDSDGIIIAGHTRWLAAKKLDLTEVPVHVATDLTDAQARAYRLADNKTGELADWDYELLPLELGDLQAMDFDLASLGFSEDELAKLLAPDVNEGLTDPDDAPDAPEQPQSEPRALYQLGRHRLLVGDATSEDDIVHLMVGAHVDLLLTDPPYNVSYEGKTKDALTIENDEMDDAQFRSFLIAAFANADLAMRPGAAYYIWHADSEGYNFRGACRDVGWKVRQCLIWVKNTMVLGRQDFHWRHEPCLYGWKSGAAHQWLADRRQTTVLEFERPSRSTKHPTMKPVALFEYLMRNSSRPGDAVLDLFAGSGTTAIAAERLGRTAYLIEYDAKYADVIRQRWAEFVHGPGCDWQKLTPEIEAASQAA